jgi:NADH dehydrogenase FAD-containing subunit
VSSTIIARSISSAIKQRERQVVKSAMRAARAPAVYAVCAAAAAAPARRRAPPPPRAAAAAQLALIAEAARSRCSESNKLRSEAR